VGKEALPTRDGLKRVGSSRRVRLREGHGGLRLETKSCTAQFWGVMSERTSWSSQAILDEGWCMNGSNLQ
jgi:hypothetical protein